MIKNYKQYESLLNKIKGPSEKEFMDTFYTSTPYQFISNATKNGYLKGVEFALEMGIQVFDKPELLTSAVNGNNVDVVKLLIKNEVGKRFLYNGMVRATANNNLEILKLLYEYGPEYLFKTSIVYHGENFDMNLIDPAVTQNSIDCLKFLLRVGVSCNIRKVDKKYPLYLAIISYTTNKDYLEIIKLLLEYGSIVDDTIMECAEKFADEVVYNLIKNKYNEKQGLKESLLTKLEGPSIDDVKQNIINIDSKKLLTISINNNDLELLKLIFEEKPFISFANKTYAMELACEKKLYDFIKYLKNEKRIQIDLKVAAQFNDIKIFYIAEETNQYYNISDVFETALCYGNIDIIKYLLDKNKISKGVVTTAIKYVGKMFLSNDTENKKLKAIEYLFSIYDFTVEELKNIHVNNYNVRNEIEKEIKRKKLTESLLNKLSSYSDEEAYQNLIDKYNNIDDIIFAAARVDFLYGVKKALEEIEKYGNSGINYPNLIITDTIIYGSMEVLKYLIEEEGADINGYYGHNLEAAASNDHPEIIKYLLSKGADVHVNGDGPLWKAMSKGYVECAKYLLEGGAKLEQYMVNVVDKKNKPMLDLLKKYVVKESLLDKLQGPSTDEIINNLLEMDDYTTAFFKAISYDSDYCINKIIEIHNDDEDLKEYYDLYNKAKFRFKQNINMCIKVDSSDIIIDGRENIDEVDTEFYINKMTHSLYYAISPDKQLVLNYDIFYDMCKLDYSLLWKETCYVGLGLYKNTANEILNSSSFSQFNSYKYEPKKVNESLLDKLQGPSEKEIWDNFKHMTPQQMLEKSIKIDFIPGIIRAIKIGADMFQNNFYFTRIKKLLNIDDSNKEEMFKYIKLLKEPNKILIYSIRYDILEGVKLALKMGANKDNINSYNPLINCISDKKNDIAIYLISQGADIHYNDDEPIYIASVYSNFKMIKKLVDLGCDINTKDGYLMRYAIQYQALVNIKFLLYNGFDLFKNDDSMQFELAEMKNIDLIKLNNEVKSGKYDKDMEFVLD